MHTETWIERVIIQQLASEDGRYKHGYRSNQQTTGQFVVDCAYLADMTETTGRPTFHQTMELEAAVEPDVEEALQSLQEHNLITKVGDRPTGILFAETDPGSTAVWEPTETGLQEAQTLNERYTEELDTLKQRCGGVADIPPDELATLLHHYGVIPR
jgi:hypothetical protein